MAKQNKPINDLPSESAWAVQITQNGDEEPVIKEMTGDEARAYAQKVQKQMLPQMQGMREMMLGMQRHMDKMSAMFGLPRMTLPSLEAQPREFTTLPVVEAPAPKKKAKATPKKKPAPKAKPKKKGK